jgi:multidrug efflux system membrane fusion protein
MKFANVVERRAVRVGLVLLLILGIVGVVAYRAATFVSQPQQRRGRFQNVGNQPVGVARIHSGDIHLTLNALGAVTPLTTVTVTTQISGQLMSVGFKEGQIVRKGDFLAQIDPRPYQVALEQDRAQLARDEATLQQAQMDLTRYQTLAQQASLPRQTAEDQVWIVKQDQGTVEYDKAQIKAQELNLVYCRIVAPADGRVGLRQVDPGNYIQAGSSSGIVVLTLLRPISVVFSVPEDRLPAILERMHAGAPLPVTAYDRTNVTELAKGKFAALDTQVDTTTGTVKVRAIFDNPDESLFPNQFVNVVMSLNTLENVVTVPVSAVQRGAPGTYVYVVDESDTVSVHPITLGPQDRNLFAVESGLAPGERVVTDGADRLRDGAQVTIPDTSQASRTGDGQGPGRTPGGRRRNGQPGDTPGSDHANRQRRRRPQPDGTPPSPDSPQPRERQSTASPPPPQA